MTNFQGNRHIGNLMFLLVKYIIYPIDSTERNKLFLQKNSEGLKEVKLNSQKSCLD